MPGNSIWSYWLEDMPDMLYAGMYPTNTPAQKSYWGNQYGNVWQDYSSKLAKMALGGQEPNLSFSNFLGSYPWSEYWNQLSPREQGARTSLYPSYQWRV